MDNREREIGYTLDGVLLALVILMIMVLHFTMCWDTRATAEFNQVRIEIIEAELGIGP